MSLFAAFLSAIVPGTGQVYHRKYIEGGIIFFLWALWIVLTRYFVRIELIFVLIGWLFFVAFSVLDVIVFESKKTREEDIRIKEFEEMQEKKKKMKKFEEKEEKTKEELSY